MHLFFETAKNILIRLHKHKKYLVSQESYKQPKHGMLEQGTNTKNADPATSKLKEIGNNNR
jgi:hypothetical protein